MPSLVHGVRMTGKGAVAAYVSAMISPIGGALPITGAFAFVPDRIMHQVVTVTP